jgi:thioredoxin 1
MPGSGLCSRKCEFADDQSARTVYIEQNPEYRSQLLWRNEINMSEKPFHFTDANFEETISKNPIVLVDFWASWCGPCRALAPTIEELAKEYAGKVFIGKLDVDENPATSEKFNVSSIPTVVILKDCCEVDKIIGLCNKQRYVDALKKHMP